MESRFLEPIPGASLRAQDSSLGPGLFFLLSLDSQSGANIFAKPVPGAQAQIQDDFVGISGMNISPYEKGNIFNKDPLRERKLLLHDYEINKLEAEVSRKGYTIVPLTVYLKKGLVKCSIGLARGKKLYDKRESIAKKDAMREAQRDFKDSNKY